MIALLIRTNETGRARSEPRFRKRLIGEGSSESRRGRIIFKSWKLTFRKAKVERAHKRGQYGRQKRAIE